MTHSGERRLDRLRRQTFLPLLLLLLVLPGQAGGQVDAGGPGGGGDGRRRLVDSLGDLGHGGEDPCKAEQKLHPQSDFRILTVLQVKIYSSEETK